MKAAQDPKIHYTERNLFFKNLFSANKHPAMQKGGWMFQSTIAISEIKKKDTLLACLSFWRRHPDLNWGIRVLQTHALPLGYVAIWSERRGSNSLPPPWQGGALPDELRSHCWCLRAESNHRHGDFQSPALPTELQRHKFGDPERARTVDL